LAGGLGAGFILGQGEAQNPVILPGEFEAAVANEIAPEGLTHNRIMAPSGRVAS
jgi:hypothetical protein